jgi:hypothetical protein
VTDIIDASVTSVYIFVLLIPITIMPLCYDFVSVT